jgi:hypothetical protein
MARARIAPRGYHRPVLARVKPETALETDRAKRLTDFVSWVGANIRGDEKGEAQVFLDRFFQAFCRAGVTEAGATLEERIKKSDGKGTSFADLVWKPVVLIEMKKRGEDLTLHSLTSWGAGLSP